MNKKLAKKLFQTACVGNFDYEEVLAGSGEFSEQAIRELVDTAFPDSTCRGCGLAVTDADFAVWTTYWQSAWAPAHRACVGPGQRLEQIDCQTIDADCNDCRHFERKPLDVLVEVEGRLETRLRRADGECKKFNRPTCANSNFCSGWRCFEHRRTSP